MEKQSGFAVLERHDNIFKPNNDTRLYRGLTLANQLKVLLISDPTTDKSAASLSVRVGSLADPWEKQGLAHFLEHALFINTKKYPEENYFKNFIVQNGGHTNAFTSLTETVFYFDVAPNVLDGALDRFAQFFLEPLLPMDKIERELQSVHFEFENTLTSDMHRFYRVRKQVGDNKHDFAKFEIGNKDTLKFDSDCHKLLVDFYSKWYSANIMGFAVLGKESLDDLEKLVTPLFGKIANKNVNVYNSTSHPYTPAHCRKKTNIVPFTEMRKMILFFPLPDIKQDQVKSDALSYLTFLLAHEGPGSLLSQLKSLGYCTQLDVVSFFYNGFGFLDIEVDLTQGINANDQIIQLLFQYMKLLKSQQPSLQIYNEIKTINEIKFHYRDKLEPIMYVKYLSSNLNQFPINRVISGKALLGEYNAQAITEVLDFVSLNALNIQVVSPIFKQICKNLQVDSIYNVQYSVESLPDSVMEAWQKCDTNDKLYLPVANEFIPSDFALKPPTGSTSDQPELTFSNNALKVWHLQDQKYQIPKAFYGFFFKSYLVNNTPANVNMLSLFIRLFLDHINELFYSATLVGISYNICTNKFGMEIIVQGFNDKLDIFVRELIKVMLNFKINPNRYEIFYDIYLNSLKTFHAKPVTSILNFYQEQILTPNCWSYEELMISMTEISIDSMSELIKNILSHCQMETLAHGNVTQSDSLCLSQNVFSIISTIHPIYPLNPCIILDINRDIQLANGCQYEYYTNNDIQENHGLLIFYQIGLEDLYLRSRLELFHQLISEPYFNQIRLAEQLAYVTFVQLKFSWSGTIGLCILIQSAYTVEYLETRIEEFMKSMEAHINELSKEVFEKEKNALITKLTETPKWLFGYSYQLWNEIVCGQYVFGRNKKIAAHIKNIKKDTIIGFYRNSVKIGGSKSRKLIIGIRSSKCVSKSNPSQQSLNKEENTKKSDPVKQAPVQSANEQVKTQPTSEQLDKAKQNAKNSKPVEKPRYKITDIRKFKCENSLCRLPRIITDKI